MLHFSCIFCVILTISHFVSCCFYLDTLCDHFDHLLSLVEFQFEQTTKCDPNEERRSSHSNLFPAKKRSFITAHSNKFFFSIRAVTNNNSTQHSQTHNIQLKWTGVFVFISNQYTTMFFSSFAKCHFNITARKDDGKILKPRNRQQHQ